jgi:hypothetical protein
MIVINKILSLHTTSDPEDYHYIVLNAILPYTLA